MGELQKWVRENLEQEKRNIENAEGHVRSYAVGAAEAWVEIRDKLGELVISLEKSKGALIRELHRSSGLTADNFQSQINAYDFIIAQL